jgi:hypothetical protein
MKRAVPLQYRLQTTTCRTHRPGSLLRAAPSKQTTRLLHQKCRNDRSEGEIRMMPYLFRPSGYSDLPNTVHQRFKSVSSASCHGSRQLTRYLHRPNDGVILPSIAPQTFSRRSLSTKTEPLDIADPVIKHVFEPHTGTFQYIVADPATKKAAIVDPVLDYEPATQAITTTSADALIALALKHGYEIDWILETHAHADHITAASYLKSRLENLQGHRPTVGIGKRIEEVQKLFASRYGVPNPEWEGVFDRLFEDDEEFTIGEVKATALHLPGHTPDHLGYKIGGKFTQQDEDQSHLFTIPPVFHTRIVT